MIANKLKFTVAIGKSLKLLLVNINQIGRTSADLSLIHNFESNRVTYVQLITLINIFYCHTTFNAVPNTIFVFCFSKLT